MTIHDVHLYAWAAVLVLAISLAFPPAFLLYLLFPRWHRNRLAAKAARARAARFHRLT